LSRLQVGQSLAETTLVVLLFFLDEVHHLGVDDSLQVVPDDLGQDLRWERVDLPGGVSMLGDVSGRSGVRDLGRVRRRLMLLDLILGQSDLPDLDIGSELEESVVDVADHVLAAWVHVPEIEKDVPVSLDEPLRRLIHG